MNWQYEKDHQITFFGLLFLNFEVSDYLILIMTINSVFKVINKWIQLRDVRTKIDPLSEDS
jgi:hypothetical protein